MVREPNPIDFWRGLALVFIFINHIPGNYFARFTHANYSWSDSADLFVFLAGWGMRLMVGTNERRQSTWYLVLRLGGRIITLYAAQIMITMIAIAILAASAILLKNPLLLEWHNAAPVFHDPVSTHIGLALITHHLGYFDILPLYIALMTMAPAIAVTDRYAPQAVLPVSLLVYCVVLGFQISVPTWPVEGQWFFNPLAWQLTFVLGFVLGRTDREGAFVRRHIVSIRWIALPIVIAALLCVLLNLWWDPTRVPQPRLFFLLDKTFNTPPRLIQFLALIALMSATYPYLLRIVRPMVGFLSMLGRNSLYVFCVGSILSLIGQIVRYIYQGDIFIDTAVVVCGILIMAFTAWLPEWREKVRGRIRAARPS